jgi:hypothetical protein
MTKFCWHEFWIRKTSNKFVAWVAYMVLQFIALMSNMIPDQHVGALLWVSAIVTWVYMLEGAVDTMVQNAKMSLELRKGIQR